MSRSQSKPVNEKANIKQYGANKKRGKNIPAQFRWKGRQIFTILFCQLAMGIVFGDGNIYRCFVSYLFVCATMFETFAISWRAKKSKQCPSSDNRINKHEGSWKVKVCKLFFLFSFIFLLSFFAFLISLYVCIGRYTYIQSSVYVSDLLLLCILQNFQKYTSSLEKEEINKNEDVLCS